MVGRYVMTQHDLIRDRIKGDTVALGTYRIDSHAVDVEDGQPVGVLRHDFVGSFAIPYQSLISDEVDNLIVPVALSASHVAFSAIRMEPTWMATGEAAGVAAVRGNNGLTDRLRARGAQLDP